MIRQLIVLSAALAFVLAAGIQPVAAQTLFVEPSASQPEVEEFTVAIVLDTDGQSVMGMDVSISFNEYMLQLDGIDPAPGSPNWTTNTFFGTIHIRKQN